MFRYFVTSVVSPTIVGELQLSSVTWNDPVYGQGGSFSGAAEILPSQTKENLAALTIPDQMSLYVYDDSTGVYHFGGPIFARPWSRSSRRLTVQAQSWKSWMYNKLCTMNRADNPVGDTTFTYTATDQFAIARSLVTTALTGEVGCPAIAVDTSLSGVLRDLTFHGSDQKYLAEQIDYMANRDDGFEWYIDVFAGAGGDPYLRLVMAYQTRGGLNNQVLLLSLQDTGSNILELGDPQESALDRRSRIWATGAGQPPDQIVAYDEDPALAGGFSLLRESVTNYNDVTTIATLASHARSERAFRGVSLTQVTARVPLTDPDYTAYASGDKVSLRVSDDWVDWDFDSVRIVDRQFRVGSAIDGKADSVVLVLDLADVGAPQDSAVV